MQNLETITTRDGSRTLYSTRYGQTYHSIHGAKREAVHVFLDGTNVLGLLAENKCAHVLEIGFGAGLNFLLTSEAATRYTATLHYTGVDRSVPDAGTLHSLDYQGETRAVETALSLVAWRRLFGSSVPEGRYALPLPYRGMLDLQICDATSIELPSNRFEAVYLDPFDPKRNPELWSPAFLRLLYLATKPNGYLATYSAAGAVRRAMEAVGFQVLRRPGPPGKRECLVAHKAPGAQG